MLQLDGKYYMHFNQTDSDKKGLIHTNNKPRISVREKFIKRLKQKADKIGLPSCMQKATKSLSQPKQPFRDVLMHSVLCNMYSENMQQIYRRTPMPKCDFNKVMSQFYWNRTSASAFCCKFVTPFLCNFIEFLRGFHSIFCNVLCNIAQYFCIIISRLSSYS